MKTWLKIKQAGKTYQASYSDNLSWNGVKLPVSCKGCTFFREQCVKLRQAQTSTLECLSDTIKNMNDPQLKLYWQLHPNLWTFIQGTSLTSRWSLRGNDASDLTHQWSNSPTFWFIFVSFSFFLFCVWSPFFLQRLSGVSHQHVL